MRIGLLAYGGLGGSGTAARENALEVVHTHYAVPHAASVRLAELDLPVLHTLHGTDVNQLGLNPAFREVTARALTCGHVTAVSCSLAEQARVVFGIAAEVVPNFVDTERFRPRPDRKPRYTASRATWRPGKP